MAPLNDEERLEDRHNAVEWLFYHPGIVTEWQTLFKKIPDLEKVLTRIYKFSLENDPKRVYYSVGCYSKMNDFHRLLLNFEEIVEKLAKIFPLSKKIDSKRLSLLTRYQIKKIKIEPKSANPFLWDDEEETKQVCEPGSLPDIRKWIEGFKGIITWK